MKQAILLSSSHACASSADNMESHKLVARISIGAFLNISRKSGVSYAVPIDVIGWLDEGKEVDVYVVSDSDLRLVYDQSLKMALCPIAEKSCEGNIVAVGIGPYQEGVLNSVLSGIKKNI